MIRRAVAVRKLIKTPTIIITAKDEVPTQKGTLDEDKEQHEQDDEEEPKKNLVVAIDEAVAVLTPRMSCARPGGLLRKTTKKSKLNLLLNPTPTVIPKPLKIDYQFDEDDELPPGDPDSDSEESGDDEDDSDQGILWNEQFISYRAHDSEDNSKKLASLVEMFSSTASAIAKMIISEQHLKPDQKVIKAKSAGGVAGGDKFSENGLFFKYPHDIKLERESPEPVYLYGGNAPNNILASKCCNHDLKGWTYLMAEDKENHFQLPLLAIIDYAGYRMSAATHLPIGQDSVVYGSSDAGRNVHWDSQVHEWMVEIGQKLNLRPHIVGVKEMALCGDIEVHQVRDNGQVRYYVLDWARMFPPQYVLPKLFDHYSPFAKMLRPEFVKNYPPTAGPNEKIPLSSDALTDFQVNDPNADTMNDDIRNATLVLIGDIIPSFAKELTTNVHVVNSYYVDPSRASIMKPVFNSYPVTEPLIRQMHRRGINLQYLGLLRFELGRTNSSKKNYVMETFLLDLMLARAIKNYWSAEIQNRAVEDTRPVKQICMEVTLEILNCLVNPSLLSEWNDELVDQVLSTFGTLALSAKEKKQLPLSEISIPFIAIKFCQMCGIHLSQAAVDELQAKRPFTFSVVSIVDFLPKVKYPAILDHHTGKFYTSAAKKETSRIHKLEYFKVASEKLAACFCSYPIKREYRYDYANVLFSTFTLDPCDVQSIDLLFVAESFSLYFTERPHGSAERLRVELDFVAAVMWQLTDEEWFSNTVRHVVHTRAHAFQELFCKEYWAKVWQEHPEVINNFLEDMKMWGHSPNHQRIRTLLVDFLPWEPRTIANETVVGLPCTIAMAESLSGTRFQQVAIFQKLFAEQGLEFVNYARNFKEKTQAESGGSDSSAISNYKIALSLYQASEFSSCDALYCLFYLHGERQDLFTSNSLNGITYYTDTPNLAIYCWWYFILKLAVRESNFLDVFIEASQSLKTRAFVAFATHCELLFFLAVYLPDLKKSIRTNQSTMAKLVELYDDYTSALGTQMKASPKQFSPEWKDDFIYLHQLLLFAFPQLCPSAMKIISPLKDWEPLYCRALVEVLLDLSCRMPANIKQLQNEEMELASQVSEFAYAEANVPRKMNRPGFESETCLVVRAKVSEWASYVINMHSYEYKPNNNAIQSLFLDLRDSKKLADILGQLSGDSLHQLTILLIKETPHNTHLMEFIVQAHLQLVLRGDKTPIDQIRELWEVILSEKAYQILKLAIDIRKPIGFLVAELKKATQTLNEFGVGWTQIEEISRQISKIKSYTSDVGKVIMEFAPEFVSDPNLCKVLFPYLSLLDMSIDSISEELQKFSVECQILFYSKYHPKLSNPTKPVIQAILNNQKAFISELLQTQVVTTDLEVEVTLKSGSYRLPLMAFALAESSTWLKIFAPHYKSNPNQLNVHIGSMDLSMFLFACGHCNSSVIEFLISMKADITQKSQDIDCLQCAILNDNIRVLEYLLKLENKDKLLVDKTKILTRAVDQGNKAIVQLLLDNGVSLNDVKDDNTATQAIVDEEADFRNKKIAHPLLKAVLKNNLEITKLLLDAKADINYKNEQNSTALHIAAWNRNPEMVKELLDRGAKTDVVERLHGYGVGIPLHRACSRPQNYEVCTLLAKKSDINSRSYNSLYTPLHVAAHCGDPWTTEILLNCGARIDQPDKHNRTPLFAACWFGHLDVVKLLVNSGAKIDFADEENETPISVSAEKHSHIHHFFQTFKPGKLSHLDTQISTRKSQPVINIQPKSVKVTYESTEALFLAIQRRVTPDILLSALTSVHPERLNQSRYNALCAAAATGQIDVVQILLERGANPSVADVKFNSRTPLHLATLRKHTEIVRLLLENEANPNLLSADAETPLHYAWDSPQICQELLNHEGDPDKADSNDLTPMHKAVIHGNTETLEIMLRMGAKVNRVQENGSALHILFREGTYNIVAILKMLLKCGADVNVQDKKRMTPLHVVLYSNKQFPDEVIQLLLAKDANTNLKDKQGKDVVELAWEKEHLFTLGKIVCPNVLTNAYPREKLSLLFVAAAYVGDLNAVERIAGFLSGVNEHPKGQKSALHWAAARGHAHVVYYLLQNGATSDAPITPLLAAVEGDHNAVVNVLINHRKDVNAQPQTELPAISCATERGNATIVKMLLDAQANPDAKGISGRTAIQEAVRCGHGLVLAAFRRVREIQWEPKFFPTVGESTCIPSDTDTLYFKRLSFTHSSPITMRLSATANAHTPYFEVKIIKASDQLVIGWSDCTITQHIGGDSHGWGIGQRIKIHQVETIWGSKLKPGDIIGCALNLSSNPSMSFSLNGSFKEPMGVAFKNVSYVGGLAPTIQGRYPCCVEVRLGPKEEFSFYSSEYTPYSDLIEDISTTLALSRSSFTGQSE